MAGNVLKKLRKTDFLGHVVNIDDFDYNTFNANENIFVGIIDHKVLRKNSECMIFL